MTDDTLDALRYWFRSTFGRGADEQDTENEETDNVAVDNSRMDWVSDPDDPAATVTFSDGHTATLTDFNVDYETDLSDVRNTGNGEVSAGLVDGERELEAQFTLEVPTKTLVCVNCNHPNEVPAFNLTRVQFSGDLEPLSGMYAVGHQCEQCGFPY